MQLQASRFEALGDAFFTRLPPTPVPRPYWVGRSQAAADLLNHAWTPQQDAAWLQHLSGNGLAQGSSPIATVYSGHQFGQWAGQLGDGRAILLGECDTPSGLWEVQLKGSGRTPYSRMGDGRAVLRSSIREFLCSEAMHALGIPTTRALCVTGSDMPVRRERVETAAVVTRLAPSFIRFGHFEHFSHRGLHAELRRLADFVIEHFYPDCHQANGNPYAELLRQVTERTADMIARWQAVGFCHGVMNTDNMSILGLTLDYGPFQFMDMFDPGHICNHSDETGRYAYARQPNVAYWNLFCLGQALLPLLDDTQQALDALHPFQRLFPDRLQQQMNAKLGLSTVHDSDHQLTETLLQHMAQNRVDYTIFWRRLSESAATLGAGYTESTSWQNVRDLFLDRTAIDAWAHQWLERMELEAGETAPTVQTRMLRANPRTVLRNHLGETAIERAQQSDFRYLERLQHALQTPYDSITDTDDLADFPPDWASHIAISCSS